MTYLGHLVDGYARGKVLIVALRFAKKGGVPLWIQSSCRDDKTE